MVTVVAVGCFIVDIDCFCPFLACTIYVTFCDAVVKPDSWQYRCDRLSTTMLESISAGKLADHVFQSEGTKHMQMISLTLHCP